MGFLTPILQQLGTWLLKAVFDEVKELWASKEARDLASKAVQYAVDKFSSADNGVKLAVAKDELKNGLIRLGKDTSEHVLEHLIEKALQRLKK